MKSKLSILSVFAAACLAACSSKSSPAPAQPAANPAPAEQPAAVTAAPTAKPGLDGKWEGSSGENMPVNFTIEGNKVTGVYAGVKGQKGSCSVFASFGADADSTLNGKSFTSHGKHDEFEFNLTGNLTSDTEASGTIDWKTNTSICGPYDLSLKWTAKKMPPEPADADDGDDN